MSDATPEPSALDDALRRLETLTFIDTGRARAELAALRAEHAQHIRLAGEALGTDDSLRSTACVTVLVSAYERQRAELAALREDRERLEWILGRFAQDRAVYVDPTEARTYRCVVENLDQIEVFGEGSTVRAAIDAARRKTP
jgi:hypothetical protein